MNREWTSAKGPDGLTFGDRLTVLRERAGMDQGDLSERVRGTRRPSTVSAWETGGAVPKADSVTRLAEVLGVTVQYLLTGEDPPQREGPSGDQAAALDLLRRSLAHLASDPIPEMMKRARRIVDDGDEGLPDQ